LFCVPVKYFSAVHVSYSISIKGCHVMHNAAGAWTSSITAVQSKLEYTCICTWYSTYVIIVLCILKSRNVFTFSISVRIIVKARVLYVCAYVARNAYRGPDVQLHTFLTSTLVGGVSSVSQNYRCRLKEKVHHDALNGSLRRTAKPISKLGQW